MTGPASPDNNVRAAAIDYVRGIARTLGVERDLRVALARELTPDETSGVLERLRRRVRELEGLLDAVRQDRRELGDTARANVVAAIVQHARNRDDTVGPVPNAATDAVLAGLYLALEGELGGPMAVGVTLVSESGLEEEEATRVVQFYRGVVDRAGLRA